jgi:cation diffusion facilitator family transporter
LQKGEKIAFFSTLATFLMAISKIVVGFLFNIKVLIADGFHSLSDFFLILLSYVGLKISQKEPNSKFPYGYYKVENLITLFLSILLIFLAIGFLMDLESEISFNLVPFLVTLFSLLLSGVIAYHELKIGREENLSSLFLNGVESLADVASSFLVLLSFFFPPLSKIALIFLSIMLFRIAFEFLKDSILALLDAGNEELEYEVKAITGAKEVKVRRAGPFYFVAIGVESKGFIQDVVEEWKEKKKRVMAIDRVANVFVYFLPCKENYYLLPVENKKGPMSKICDKFSESPYFLITDLENYVYLKNEVEGLKKGIKLWSLFKDYEFDAVVVKNIGDVAKAMLKEKGKFVYFTNKEFVRDAIMELRKEADHKV